MKVPAQCNIIFCASISARAARALLSSASQIERCLAFPAFSVLQRLPEHLATVSGFILTARLGRNTSLPLTHPRTNSPRAGGILCLRSDARYSSFLQRRLFSVIGPCAVMTLQLLFPPPPLSLFLLPAN